MGNNRTKLKLRKLPHEHNPNYSPNMYICSRLYGRSFQVYFSETQREMDKLSEGVFLRKGGRKDGCRSKPKSTSHPMSLFGQYPVHAKAVRGWVDGKFVEGNKP